MSPAAAEAKPEDPIIEDVDFKGTMHGLEDTATGANN